MQNLKTVLYKSRKFLFLTFISLTMFATIKAQELKPVSDGRDNAETAKPAEKYKSLIEQSALPKARQHWKNSEACQEEFSIVAETSGSFTKANSSQTAVLYRYCTTGHNFANNGIAIIENGKIITHLVYEGAEDYDMSALQDINGNGLSELMIEDGSTNQGYTVSVISIIELSSNSVKKFGITETYEDDCGAVEKCTSTAYRVLAKTGSMPSFSRETYKKKNEKWLAVGKAKPVKLREDEIVYTFLN